MLEWKVHLVIKKKVFAVFDNVIWSYKKFYRVVFIMYWGFR